MPAIALGGRSRRVLEGVLVAATVLLMLGAASAEAARRGANADLDPLGTWRCVVYGHPSLGDERLLLRFGPDGSTAVTRAAHDATARAWVPLSTWSAIRHSFTFSDSRTGRQFEADLRRETLGGTWRTPSLVGGWWCDAIAADDSPAAADAFRSEALMPPLIPERMATPTYPRQAIRDAKQGRAVACFFVDADGVILDPQIVELSDEVFRAPSLEALGRSRYRGWGAGAISRPGCRSFIYRLDAANEPRPAP